MHVPLYDTRKKGFGLENGIVKLKGPRFSVLNRIVFGTWFLAYTYLSAHYLDVVLWVALLYLAVFALYTLDKRGWPKRGDKS